MDDARIQQLAAQHLQQLEEARQAAAERVEPTPSQVWDQHIDALIEELDVESQAWCAVYNAAVGSEKLVCENHDRGINVNSGDHGDGARLDVQPAPLRSSQCFIDIGYVHEPEPIEIRPEGQALVLLVNGQPTGVEGTIAYLLERFTTRLTQGECAEL